jgi:hemoglobin
MRTLRWLNLALLAVVWTAGGGAIAWAADPEKPPPALTAEQKAFDLKLRKDLFDVINRGCDLYNEPVYDPYGCYRLYEGALRTAAPLLDHHPQLQKLIAKTLEDAEKTGKETGKADEAAFMLRKMLDKVRDELKNEAALPATAKSLWERLGGEKGVAKVVDDFVALAGKDPKVNFFRDGKYKLDDKGVAKMKQHLVEFVSAATGGPLKYSGRDMKEVHKDMAITDEEFDACVKDLKNALEKNDVEAADKDALVKIVESTRRDIVAPKKPSESPAKTQWDRLGGEKGVGKIVADLMDTVSKDPDIKLFPDPTAQPKPDQLKKIREDVIDYISSKTGGPRKYEGKSMKEIHAGMKITERQFDAFVADFEAVLKNNGVKDDDVKELVDAVKAMKKDIVEAKKPDEKPTDKGADKKSDDK